MAARRPRLAGRRKALGYSQEFLADKLGVDRTTVGRWERGETEPFPYLRRKLCQVLQVPPAELDTLLTPEPGSQAPTAGPGTEPAAAGRSFPAAEPTEATDDMYRHELLRLLNIAGVIASVPAAADSGEHPPSSHPRTPADLAEHAELNAQLWQVFALATAKRNVYPLVHEQLNVLISEMRQDPPGTVHRQLSVLTCDLFQLAGEIFFGGNQYTHAAHCYALAATVGREARSYYRWACALTRQAFVNIYDRQYAQAADVLGAVAQVARNGDNELSTRQWVAAVRAQAHAGLGDLRACQQALDDADRVTSLSGTASPGGWLRFDHTRLAEERGTCYLALGQARLAQDTLDSAVGGTVSLRRRGSIQVDLAMLSIQHKDTDQVLHYTGNAIDIAEQTRSAGYLGRKLKALQPHIQPLVADPRISDLNDRITQMPVG